MESVVSGANSIFQLALTGIHDLVEDKMKEAGVSSAIISSITSILSDETQYTNVFKGLEIIHQQNQYIKANFPLVSEYTL